MKSAVNFRAVPLCKDLFRSGSLSLLDEEDAEFLRHGLAVRTYIDLRTSKEIANAGSPRALLARDIEWVQKPLLIRNASFEALTRPSPEDWFRHYEVLLEQNQLSEILELLSESTAPVVFGCSDYRGLCIHYPIS